MVSILRLPGTLALFAVVLALSACEDPGKQAASAGEQLKAASQTYVLNPLKSTYEANFAPRIEDSSERLANVEQSAAKAQEAAETVGEAVKDTKEGVQSAKEAVRSKAKEVKQTARYWVRKVPRSRKEANQVAYEEGKGLLEWIREGVNSFVENNQLRRSPKSHSENKGA